MTRAGSGDDDGKPYSYSHYRKWLDAQGITQQTDDSYRVYEAEMWHKG